MVMAHGDPLAAATQSQLLWRMKVMSRISLFCLVEVKGEELVRVIESDLPRLVKHGYAS